MPFCVIEFSSTVLVALTQFTRFGNTLGMQIGQTKQCRQLSWRMRKEIALECREVCAEC